MLIDIATNILMQSIQTPVLTTISKIISSAFNPLTVIIASFILAVYFYIKFSKKRGIFFASVILLTGILIKVFKEIFQRARPLDSVIQGSGFSFPSGHATIVVVFFGLLAFFFSEKKSKQIKLTTALIAFLIMLLTAFSRIYLGVHWLTDVIGGLVLGGIILISAIIVYKNNHFPGIST